MARSRSLTKRHIRGPRSDENSQWKMMTTRLSGQDERMGVLRRKSSTWSSWCRFRAPCNKDEPKHFSHKVQESNQTSVRNVRFSKLIRDFAHLDVSSDKLVGISAVDNDESLD